MLRLCTLLCLALACSVANAQVGFQVSPGKIFFRQQANQPGTQTVMVMNSSANKLILEAKFMDWKRDSLAQKTYFTPGTIPNGISKYIQVNPATIELEPGESRLVEVILNLPEGADRQTGNAMLFLTQINEKDIARPDKPKGPAVVFKVQMGIHVYNEPPQLFSKSMAIEDVLYQAAPASTPSKTDSSSNAGSNAIRALIANIGERVVAGTCRFELTNTKTLTEWKSKPQDFNSLPGDTFFVTENLPGTLAKGHYAVVTIVDFGADQPLKVAESEIDIL